MSQTLREVLATNGELRRKVQSAASVAAYTVLKEAGYTITAEDIEEVKADQTAIAVALDEVFGTTARSEAAEIVVATGVAIAIATGGF